VFSWLDSAARLRVNSQIQLRTPGGTVRDANIAGIEMLCGPKVDRSKAEIVLSPNITKSEVPNGTELWLASALPKDPTV
jgi:hypothetical protein